METRNCQNCKTDFTIKPEDFVFYQKIKVPPPTFCPDCRAQRRMAWRNEHALFKKTDALTGVPIFSAYHQDSPIQVYANEYWNSDAWDPMDYGRDYDFSRSFFEQFNDLMLAVPAKSRNISRDINSDYSNNAGNLKNCYLCFNVNDGEDCAYGVLFNRMKNSYNFGTCSTSDKCYETFNITDSSSVQYSADCADAISVFHSIDCRNCQNCIGCVGLRNKNYYIFNEPYTKEAYAAKVQELNLGSFASRQMIAQKMHELYRALPRKYIHTMKCLDVSGEYVFNSKNVYDSWLVLKSQDIQYCQDIRYATDTQDSTAVLELENESYENTAAGLKSSQMQFTFECHPNNLDIMYSVFCSGSSHLFGCVGLRKKEYCIFNKQYTKEEYEMLKQKIIDQMREVPYIDARGRTYFYGEFFPVELSPLAYNETIAQEFFPLTKNQAQDLGYVWRDHAEKDHVPTIASGDIPDHINDVPDTYLAETIACADGGTCNHGCTKAFRLIPTELAFYRQMQIPLPRKCPNCRYYNRLVYRSPMKLYPRSCMCAETDHGHVDVCLTEFQTSYSPAGREIVYCESCYQKTVL